MKAEKSQHVFRYPKPVNQYAAFPYELSRPPTYFSCLHNTEYVEDRPAPGFTNVN
jgi:hypothetical protein